LQEALPYYRAALAVKPHDPEIRGNLGVALSKLNDLDGAIAEFRQAAGNERRSGVASFNLGTHLLRNGDTAEAIPVLERVTAAAPDNALAHFWLGRAYETAARPAEAIREYRAALARKPEDASIQDALRRLVPE
jgi:Flp pilus assembly protein TadD